MGEYFGCQSSVIDMLSIQDLNTVFYDSNVGNDKLLKRMGAQDSDFHFTKALLKEYSQQRSRYTFCLQNNLDPNVMAVAEVHAVTGSEA